MIKPFTKKAILKANNKSLHQNNKTAVTKGIAVLSLLEEMHKADLTIAPAKNEEIKHDTCQNITDRNNTEEKIKETKISYHSLIEHSTDAICIADASMKIIDINSRGCYMLGYTKAEFLLLTIADLFILKDLVANPLKIDELNTGNIVSNERRFKRKDGTTVEVEINARIIEDRKFVIVARDTTERKKAAKELQAAFDEKNIILERIADAFFAVDKNWIVTYWNNQAEILLQHPRNKILGYGLWEIFSDSINSISYKKYQEVLDTNLAINFEDYYPVLNKWFEISAYPSATGLSVYFKDVTERKNAESALNKANLDKTTILESIDDGFFAIDKNSLVTYWNRKAEELLGEKRENVIGKNLHEMFARPDSTVFYENYQKAIRENSTVHFEGFSKRSNKWFAVSAFASDNGLSVHFKDVTERKSFEEKIKESELRYRSLVEQAYDTICIIDTSFKFIEVNPSGCAMFGYTREEVLNLHMNDMLFEEDLKVNPIKIEDLNTGKSIYNERRIKRKDGTLIEVELSSKLVEDGIIIVFGRDITERKKDAQKLKESNQRYNLICKTTNDMVWDWDLITGNVYRNKEGWKKIFRTGDKEIDNALLSDWNNRIHPEDKYIVNQISDEIRNSGKDFFEVECRVLRDDGSYAYIHDRGNIFRNSEGKAVRLIGATQDITQRKEAEFQVAKSEMHFRSLVQNSTDITSILDARGIYFYCSPAIKKILGYEPEFMIGKNALGFVHPDDMITLKAHLRKNYNKNYLIAVQFRFKNIKGEWRWLESKVTDMSKHPEVNGYIFNSRDITERKIAEEEIEKLSIIARETTNSVIITDIAGKIIWVNEGFTNITEYESDEVIGKKPGDFLHGEETNPAVVRFMRNKLKNAEPFECDILNYSKTGRKYWIRLQCQPQLDETGKLKSFFAIETDITKEKEAEGILKASEGRYRYLFNNNPASIIIWDINTFKILEVNNTAMNNYGYTRSEFLAKKILELYQAEEHGNIKHFAAVASKENEFKTEITCKHINKSGDEMYMNISAHLIQFKGQPVILALANNITEKIFLENELENERLIKQQEITAAVISAQEQERQELGSELHDNINQILAGSRLYLGLARKELKIDHPYLIETDTLINSAITEIRNLSHSLIPPLLHDSELMDAINNIIEVTQKTSGINVSLRAFGFDETTISDKLKLSIYRIIQEQFNNILKHAAAEKIIVRLIQDKEKTVLSIKDDGVGFDSTKKAKGVGLLNIKTRASLFKGEMMVISSPGNGCELRVSFN